MITVNVLLSGRLKLKGYGVDLPKNPDGTLVVTVEEGSGLADVVRGAGVPQEEVALTMVNGRTCRNGVVLRSGDRVVLAPADVACLWRHVGVMNLGINGSTAS